jgi:hypothetical protein
VRPTLSAFPGHDAKDPCGPQLESAEPAGLVSCIQPLKPMRMGKVGDGLWMTRSALGTLTVRLPQCCNGGNGQSEKLSISYQYHISIHIELYLGHFPYDLRSNQLLSGWQCKVFGYQLAKPLMLRVDRKKMNAASWR